MGPEPSRTKLHPICPHFPHLGMAQHPSVVPLKPMEQIRGRPRCWICSASGPDVVLKLLRCQKTWQFQMSKTVKRLQKRLSFKSLQLKIAETNNDQAISHRGNTGTTVGAISKHQNLRQLLILSTSGTRHGPRKSSGNDGTG